MANRLAFQTQLASIMEVLANAAVAEICKLVDDDYAVVSLQMSQCQRENKVLKRKLRLLELKMARGNAERRLRESAANNGRPRVQINSGDSLRKSSLTTSAVFERPVDVVLWSSRGDAGNEESQVVLSEHIQSKSPDVELVEPEAVLVKEEKIEPNMSHITEPEEDVPLLGDNRVPEHVPSGSAGQGPSYEQQNSQTQAQNQTLSSKRRRTGSNNNRGVEKEEEPNVVLVKVEEVELATGTRSQTGFSIQEGVVESSTDDYRGVLPFDETTQPSTGQLQESGGGFSEPAAPQVTLTLTEDPSSIGAVQLRVPDTNTPANCNAQHQSQRSVNSSSATSQYSLFELETFFTRWAPDNESVSAPGGPACSFSTDDSVDSDHDGVIMLENEPSASSAGRISGGHSTVHTQPTQALSARTSTSTSVPTKIQAPLSQQLWSRTPAMIRGAQAELQQQQHSSLSTQSAAALTNSAGKTGASRISPVCRTMISIAAPQSAFPVRGSTVVLASNESAIAGQHGANLLAHHSKNQIAITVTGERRKKSHICRACGKAFTGLSNLEAHERVHTGEKPFRCDTCGKHFSEAGNLKKHQRVHTGEKPFSCAQCGKRFAWICNLRTHQQSATGCAGQVMGGLGESSSHTIDHGQEC